MIRVSDRYPDRFYVISWILRDNDRNVADALRPIDPCLPGKQAGAKQKQSCHQSG
jgi:hypothetical protein